MLLPAPRLPTPHSVLRLRASRAPEPLLLNQPAFGTSFFSCLGTATSDFSTFWHSVRSLPRPARGPWGACGRCPCPSLRCTVLSKAPTARCRAQARAQCPRSCLVLVELRLPCRCPFLLGRWCNLLNTFMMQALPCTTTGSWWRTLKERYLLAGRGFGKLGSMLADGRCWNLSSTGLLCRSLCCTRCVQLLSCGGGTGGRQ